MSKTPYLGLEVTPEEQTNQTFLDYRLTLSGDAAGSNMMILDGALAALDLSGQNDGSAVPLRWVQGHIAPGNGVYYPGHKNYVCDPTFYDVTAGTKWLFYIPTGLRLVILCYDENQEYLGRYLTNATEADGVVWWFTIPVEGTTYSGATNPSGSTAETRYLRFETHYTPTLAPILPGNIGGISAHRPVNRASGLPLMQGVTLDGTTSLDSVVLPGVYHVTLTADSNAPFTGPVMLAVLYANGYAWQVVLRNTAMGWRRSVNTITARSRDITGWGAWMTSGYLKQVAATDDFDDLVYQGTYYVARASLGAAHAPVSDIGFLQTMGFGSPTSGNLQQIFHSSTGDQYHRFRGSAGGWGAWRKSNKADILKTFDTDTAVALTMGLQAAKTEWTPVESDGGIPVLNSSKTSGEWATYAPGEPVSGLPYSSVYISDLQGTLFYQRTLEAFYSAVENPRSLLYTQRAGVPGETKTKACVYGTACSAFASAAFGFKVLYNTASLMELGTLVNVTSPEDIHPGMLLLKKVITVTAEGDEDASYHTVIIKSIQLRVDGSYSITTAESVAPLTRERNYTWDELQSMMAGSNGYKVYDFNIDFTDGYAGITVGAYATDMIPDRGNNTWYETGDEIPVWFRDPTVTTIYLKAPGGAWQTVDLEDEGYTIDADTGVCDLSGLFSTTGIWEFTTSADAKENGVTGKVAIIDKSLWSASYDATAHTFTLTHAGGSGCAPSWYEFSISGSGAGPRASGVVDNPGSTVTIQVPESVYGQPKNWWIRVNYDTGFACSWTRYDP